MTVRRRLEHCKFSAGPAIFLSAQPKLKRLFSDVSIKHLKEDSPMKKKSILQWTPDRRNPWVAAVFKRRPLCMHGDLTRLRSVIAFFGIAALSGAEAQVQVNVTQEHNNPSRNGVYIDAAFTSSAAANLTRDLGFNGTISGNV